jgi:serine protease AprX
VASTGNTSGVNFTYSWRVNGFLVRTQPATHSLTDSLPLGPYGWRSVVTITVTPSVGSKSGTAATDSETLVDHAPVATVTLSGPPKPGPAPGGPSASPWRPSGQLTATVAAGDPDGDHVQLTYVWKVNGAIRQVTSLTASTGDHFTIDSLKNADVVTVTVIPFDGILVGDSDTASGFIANLPPTADVRLAGSTQVGATATANATASDPEGSPVTFTYVWLLNGAQMQVDTNRGPHDDFAIDASAKAGQTLSVRVIPNDGYVNGHVATDSATLTKPTPPPAPPAQRPGPGPGGPGPGGPGPGGPGPGGPGSQSQSSGSSQTTTSQDSSSYDPTTDPYSMYETTLGTGAQSWWSAGYTGKGVDVAVIDTGVSQVPGLDASGKVVYGPDLSLDSQSPNLRNLDANGHGTFMAGLIAGRDSSLSAPYTSAGASTYRGMAPDARIVSVKVGDADGGVDVTQVIAAIDWVVQHAHDPGFNIRVINLAYGTNSTQPYLVDPLAFAVEQAWKAGIVVVAAAGNTGYQEGSGAPGVADPAYDPFIIGVGGYDTMGTIATGDDRLGGYSASSSGCSSAGGSAPLCKGPDFIADGSHLQGLRDPGSFVDDGNPTGRLGTRYFRGSGTSEATAITAGAVALILQRFPQLTPDQVKRFLTTGAKPIAGVDPKDGGAGEIDLGHLLTAPAPPATAQSFTPSDGSGTIEGSRGQDHLTLNGIVLQGEEDIFGQSVDTTALAAQEAADASWNRGVWNGSTWSGSTWSGNTWSGSTWSGNTWSGNTWSGSTWSGNTWSGNTWSGSTWSGSTWSGNTWSGNTWSGSTWSGSAWASDDWD